MNELEIKILNAALIVFSKKGYKNATTRLIASEAGVNESTIFRKFKTKQNLFETIIHHNREIMGEKIEHCKINMEKTDDPKVNLEYVLNSILAIMNTNYDVLHLMITEHTNLTVKRELEYFTEAVTHGLEAIKPPEKDIDLQVVSLMIISFLLFVLYEDVITPIENREVVLNEFKDYCAKLLGI